MFAHVALRGKRRSPRARWSSARRTSSRSSESARSWMVKPGWSPICSPWRRRSRVATAWNVPPHTRPDAARSLAPPPRSPSTRRSISAAARRAKVTRRMRSGRTPRSMRWATRCASVVVLPVPAPATMSSGSSPCAAASRCRSSSASSFTAAHDSPASGSAQVFSGRARTDRSPSPRVHVGGAFRAGPRPAKLFVGRTPSPAAGCHHVDHGRRHAVRRERMRVLLVGPNQESNLSLLYLAASLRAAGHAPEIAAFNEWGDAPSVLRAAQGADLVGLSMCFQVRAGEFLALAAELEREAPGRPIVAGGHHASCAATALLDEYPALDLIVIHEGERTLVALADLGEALVARAGEVPGVAYRSEGRAVLSPPRPIVADLDRLPRPDRAGPARLLCGVPTAYLMGSRGCVSDCDYCCITTLHNSVRSFGRSAACSTARAASHGRSRDDPHSDRARSRPRCAAARLGRRRSRAARTRFHPANPVERGRGDPSWVRERRLHPPRLDHAHRRAPRVRSTSSCGRRTRRAASITSRRAGTSTPDGRRAGAGRWNSGSTY